MISYVKLDYEIQITLFFNIHSTVLQLIFVDNTSILYVIQFLNLQFFFILLLENYFLLHYYVCIGLLSNVIY